MATTKNTHTGNGNEQNFAFTFPYIKQTDVKASINGTDTTDFTFHNATTVRFNSAPAADAAIVIYRSTSGSDLVATFYPGSAIRSTDLNDNFTQNLYVTQEASDLVEGANTDSAAALELATTANNNANTALDNSRTTDDPPVSAISIANTASINATNAVNTADAAAAQVSSVLPFEIVADKTALAAKTPAEGSLFEVTSAEGADDGTINWVTEGGDATTLSTSVTWNSGITLKAKKYGTTTNDNQYVFQSYFANDPEDRYGSSTVVQSNKTIDANYTIKTGMNGMSIGPVVVADGATLTIPANTRYVVI